MTDSIPAGFTLTGNTTTQGTYAGGVWNIGTLNVGDTVTITLTGTIDAGQAGNTITNVTTAATGDQMDPTTAGDDLNESVVVEDNTTDLVTVKTLASGDSTPDEGDTVTFQIDVTNNGGAQATNVTLTDSLPAGFTLTGDTATQGTYVNGVWNIGTLGVGDTATITLTGTIDAGQGGNTITNVVTAATGDQVDPTTAGDDLDESVVVNTPVVLVADIGVAKTASDAVANGDYFDVTFVLLVENTGTATLDGITLTDDVVAQFGNAYVAANNLAVTNFVGSGTAPTANAGWLTDPSQSLLSGGSLNVGDYVEVTFVVTIDPDGIDGVSQSLLNQAIASGNGVNTDGSPLLDGFGNLIVATDLSDNGAGATGDNGDGGTDDPTPVVIADLGIAKSVAGQPVLTASGNSVVTFEVVIANTGSVDLSTLSLQEDIAAQFGGAFVSASNLTLIGGPSGANSLIALESTFNGATVTELLDQTTNNYLAVGDSFTIAFDIEVNPDNVTTTLTNQVSGTGFAVDANGNFLHDANGNRILASDLSDSGVNTSNTNAGDAGDAGTSDDPTPVSLVPGVVDADLPPGTTSGSPARLIGLPIFSRAPISQLFSGFLGGPGPIYSGIPIASNANPLTLQSNRAITGGYATQFAVPTDMGVDCGCGDVVDGQYDAVPYDDGMQYDNVMPYDNAVPYDAPIMEEVSGDCGVCEGAVQAPVDEVPCQSCQEVAPCAECSDCGNCCGCGGGRGNGGVLFRMRNWLHR